MKCKSCGAPLKWCEMASGVKMPLDATPSKAVQIKEGIGEIVDVYQAHWASCPGADKHRKKL